MKTFVGKIWKSGDIYIIKIPREVVEYVEKESIRKGDVRELNQIHVKVRVEVIG